MNVQDNDILLDVKDLGRLLKLSAQAVFTRLCRGGDLPPGIRIGKLRRWRRQTVAAWLAEREGRAGT
ncbi:MAG: helix-turn-helix domain-containing protein [Nitrospirae bacterium]|nr:helix-turn-helix domain-containing protein [Nitrospirota bacterium]